MSLPQLRRVRWAVRATLSLGVAASVAANILHAEPNPISQVIAAWPPLALLLTVELISRVPVHRRSLAAVRLGATTAIAGIAAWVSYWHMAGVAARYGETGASPYLLPLSVDGLVIVASVSLVELAGRIRLMEEALAAETAARTAEAAHTAQAARAAEAARVAEPALAAGPAGRPALGPDGATILTRAPAAGAAVEPGTPTHAGSRTRAGATPAKAAKVGAEARPKRPQPRRTTPARDETAPAKRAAKSTGKKTVTARPRRPVEETAALAARIQADQPGLTQADVAAQLGITTQRLRQIKRLVPAPAVDPAELELVS